MVGQGEAMGLVSHPLKQVAGFGLGWETDHVARRPEDSLLLADLKAHPTAPT